MQVRPHLCSARMRAAEHAKPAPETVRILSAQGQFRSNDRRYSPPALPRAPQGKPAAAFSAPDTRPQPGQQKPLTAFSGDSGPDKARPAPLQQCLGPPAESWPLPATASPGLPEAPHGLPTGLARSCLTGLGRPSPQPAPWTTGRLQDRLQGLHSKRTTRPFATLSGDKRKPHRPPSRALHSPQSRLLQKPLHACSWTFSRAGTLQLQSQPQNRAYRTGSP